MIWYFDTLDISKPLVFLCGPFFSGSPDDRRLLLKKHIENYWVQNGEDKPYIHAIPLILDSYLKEETIKRAGLKINLLEEIISNISYKTYIFLDSISTGYELGQFTNYSYGNKNSTVFIDYDYIGRPSNKIGNYINLSFENNFIKYDCEYKINKNERLIYFTNVDGKQIIPEQILNQLNMDNPVNNSYIANHKIHFTKNRDKLMDDGSFIYEFVENVFTIETSIKNLFYYVSMVYRKYNHLINFDNLSRENSRETISAFKEKVKSELMSSFVCLCEDKQILKDLLKPDSTYNIRCGTIDVDELIFHIAFLSGMYIDYRDGKKEYLTQESSKIGFSFSHKSKFEAVGIIDQSILSYLKKYDNYLFNDSIKLKTINIKGKKRKIVFYNTNYSGKLLRSFHKIVDYKLLSLLPTSSQSFAYKKTMNTFICIKKHEGNCFFYKLDIEKYFESIKFSFLIHQMNMYFTNKVNSMFMNKYFVLSNDTKKYITKILIKLYYKYSLPIGFSTSPKISDFYLYNIDEIISKIDGITYTRYADDILISSNSKDNLDSAVSTLKHLLSTLSLKINDKKTICKALIHNGDSIKFLGINLVKRPNNKYSYTISNKYLVETSKMAQKCASKFANKDQLIKLIGRVKYIKSISTESFYKLIKMINVKLSGDSVFIDKILKC